MRPQRANKMRLQARCAHAHGYSLVLHMVLAVGLGLGRHRDRAAGSRKKGGRGEREPARERNQVQLLSAEEIMQLGQRGWRGGTSIMMRCSCACLLHRGDAARALRGSRAARLRRSPRSLSATIRCARNSSITVRQYLLFASLRTSDTNNLLDFVLSSLYIFISAPVP